MTGNVSGAAVRAALLRDLERAPASCGVALSGGIDSQAVVFALVAAGRRPTCYSFTLEDRQSSDFLQAEATARRLRLPFVPVLLPTDLGGLAAYIRAMTRRGYVRKTTVECAWPFLHLIRAFRGEALYSGWFTDALFCLSKSGVLRWRNRIDDFRANQRAAEFAPGGQLEIFSRACAARGAAFRAPFGSAEMEGLFRGTSWDAVNRPHQKQPILDAFPEDFATIRVRDRTNLHIGDSGIRDLFASLLGTPLNTRGLRNAGALYRDVAAGVAPVWPEGADDERNRAWLGRLLPERAGCGVVGDP